MVFENTVWLKSYLHPRSEKVTGNVILKKLKLAKVMLFDSVLKFNVVREIVNTHDEIGEKLFSRGKVD